MRCLDFKEEEPKTGQLTASFKTLTKMVQLQILPQLSCFASSAGNRD